jgi:hypothetical protein
VGNGGKGVTVLNMGNKLAYKNTYSEGPISEHYWFNCRADSCELLLTNLPCDQFKEPYNLWQRVRLRGWAGALRITNYDSR